MWRISDASRIERLVVFRRIEGVPAPAGELTFTGQGRQRAGRFAYAASYRARDARPLDPVGLRFGRAVQLGPREEVPLAFHDVGPDGWGKGIFDQAFPGLTLSMPEYLALGGLDRTGDLAFGPDPDTPASWRPSDAPLLALPGEEDDLEALVRAAEAVDGGRSEPHHLARLFRASADIGGARPKARLRADGAEWIAKFPSWGDAFDMSIAECASLDVAEAAGLPVPERRVVTIAGRSVLLVRRFDRSRTGRPAGYLSAGTILKEPHTVFATRKTYLDIAVAAQSLGAVGAAEAMYRRLLVNSWLRNTDDHLRNHALIDEGNGWRLSPVFDVVPHPPGKRHVCAPAPGISPEWNPALAFSSHRAFGLDPGEAGAIRDQVVDAVRRFSGFLDARGMARAGRDSLLDALRSQHGV